MGTLLAVLAKDPATAFRLWADKHPFRVKASVKEVYGAVKLAQEDANEDNRLTCRFIDLH